MTGIEVLIPWRDPGCEVRRRSCEAVAEYYAQVGDVVFGDSPAGAPFNVSAARNAAAAAGSSDVCVFIDADAVVDLDVLRSAVEVARRRPRLVKPFARAGYLSREASEAFLESRSLVWEEWISGPEDAFCGLAWVIRRDAFAELGGFDPGFVGYGGEDNAFTAAAELFFGPQRSLSGVAASLWHPADRVASEGTWERTRAYWAMTSRDDYYRLRGDVRAS